MTLMDFYERVEAHALLEGVGLVPAGDGVGPALIVRYRPSGMLTRVEVDGLPNHDWLEMEALLTGALDPTLLYHMARVVGYFSRLSEWNSSKIGEQRDRRKGNYRIP